MLLGNLELLLLGLVLLTFVGVVILLVGVLILALETLVITQQGSLTAILQASRVDLPVTLLGFVHDFLRLAFLLLLHFALLQLDLACASDLVLLRESWIRVHKHRYSMVVLVHTTLKSNPHASS